MATTRLLVLPLLLVLVAGRAPAQTPDPDLTAVRAKPELGDEDRALIRAYLTRRIEVLRGKDDTAAQTAATELRTAYDGSDGFKKAYAAVCAEVAGAAIKKLELAPATRLMTVLNTLQSAETLPALLEGLRDDRVGVRTAAALGLRSLRDKLAAAGKDVYSRALTSLKEVGRQERARETLKAIYAAMNYAELSAGADAKATALAVLELLEERAKQYGGGELRAAGADDAGLRIMKAVAGTLEEAERKRLMIVTGTMLLHAVQRYSTGAAKLAAVHDRDGARDQIELRNAMERLILVGEELLTVLLKPEKSPDVTDPLRKLNTADLRVEWQKWVGLLEKAVGQDFSITESAGDEAAGG